MDALGVGSRAGGTAGLCLPEGSTELMCHPGYCGETLRAARTALDGYGIELVDYGGLE